MLGRSVRATATRNRDSTAFAVEPFGDPTPTKWTLEKLDSPPTRETKFERLDTEFPVKLSRPDPKLLEQKYVAIVRLSHPEPSPDVYSTNGTGYLELWKSPSPGFESDRYSLLQKLGGKLLIAGLHRLNEDSIHSGFERLLKEIPQDRLPADDKVAFFASKDVDHGFLNVIATNGTYPSNLEVPYTEIQILAASPELAEERVNVLLQLLDQGGSRAIRIGVFKHRATLVTQWQEARKQLDATEAQLVQLQEKMATYTDFTSDMLTGLRLQQLQLDVQLAGASARLATCDKLLKQDSPLAAASRTKVEDMKLATEIEVAGIEASRQKSAEVIGLVKTKNELIAQQEAATANHVKLRKKFAHLIRTLKEFDVALEQNAPMPLVEGKVLIQPIKWTK